jgi:hypothetical protein
MHAGHAPGCLENDIWGITRIKEGQQDHCNHRRLRLADDSEAGAMADFSSINQHLALARQPQCDKVSPSIIWLLMSLNCRDVAHTLVTHLQ